MPSTGFQAAPLKAFPLTHQMMKSIEHIFLVAAPIRGKQDFFGAVSGDPVDNDVRRKMLKAGNQDIQISLQRQDGKFPVSVGGGKVCSLQDVEKLELDAERIYGV